MSRTLKDVPWKVWKDRNPDKYEYWPYPAPKGGVWAGRSYWANVRNRQFRYAGKRGEEPVLRKGVAWDIW